jgi:hypothetical protein
MSYIPAAYQKHFKNLSTEKPDEETGSVGWILGTTL